MATTVLTGALSGDEGREIAREELSKRVYDQAEPGLIELVYTRVSEWLNRVLAEASTAVPGGWWVLGPLLFLLVALAGAAVGYARPARRARRAAVVTGRAAGSPDDHRAAAERHAAAGDHTAAIRERLRAISRSLEERAVLAPRPGRTATELATEASAMLPEHRAAFERAARMFNDTVYGRRPAEAEEYQALRELDEALPETRPLQEAGQRQ
ncbi:uncharacterized protein DUF4129 [Haloactinospora alba]|uniref:Uncharacterized protein DUF4129 n=1 Tax=Haloactinospora alba TaxID=405555 RepID=A0A543NF37_9ACTN|nr:DUF4129 domain-containing protein [Haloactinospora alba]TQN30445.1 uncharacterized protein DUF4129 [Haloactinospora alba]